MAIYSASTPRWAQGFNREFDNVAAPKAMLREVTGQHSVGVELQCHGWLSVPQ